MSTTIGVGPDKFHSICMGAAISFSVIEYPQFSIQHNSPNLDKKKLAVAIFHIFTLGCF